ncbi:MAG: hypothetical protein HXY34_12130 [Candidatus Thorarchaeota archaeon]|nr:hypothetical protein [Candidatus Thorarchaeota archaeon]
MATHRRNLIIGFFVVILFFALPCGTSAATDEEPIDSNASLSITYANYLDLDNDGLSDDILTESLLLVPRQLDVWFTLQATVLTLPSGILLGNVITLDQDYTGLTVTIGWYNAAKEPGWYKVSAFAVVITLSGPIVLQAEMLFDPPGGGDPGPPLITDVLVESNTTITP